MALSSHRIRQKTFNKYSITPPTRFSDAQLANQMGTALTTFLLHPVKDCVKISMKNSPKDPGWSAYNLASSVNKREAIGGDYPNLAVDFKKVILSIGDIPVPLNPQVSLTDNQIHFTGKLTWIQKVVKRTTRSCALLTFLKLYRHLKFFTVPTGEKKDRSCLCRLFPEK